jgi:hypothetical protein
MNLNKLKIPDLSGQNLSFSLSTNLITKSVSYSFYNRGTNKFLEKNYLEFKSKYENNEFSISDLVFDENLNHFVNHLLFDLVKQLSINEIESDVFILKSFKIISECSKQENFQIYFNEFIDYYRLNNRYDLVLSLFQTGKITIDFSLIHDAEYNLKKRILSGELLLSILNINSSLNGIVRDKLKQFSGYMDTALSNLYSNKYSFYTALFGIEKSVHEINKEFTMKFVAIEDGRSLKFYQTKRKNSFEYYHKNKGKKMFKKYEDVLLSFQKNEASQKWIINSWKGDGNGPVWYGISNPLSYENGSNSFFNYIENTFTNIFKLLVINSQDDFRVSIGLPKIGQGWVSETNLYNAVNIFFETENVVQHASPKWLGRQHLDIYFPNLNIGIEYQGKQHNEPVSFFGGEEAFNRTVERDERKKHLCLENGCLLFYVYPETNTDEFLLELESIIFNRKNS